jgi:hypothetical protein
MRRQEILGVFGKRNVTADHFGSQRGGSIVVAFRPAILDFDVLTFEVAVIAATGGEPSALAKAATVKTPIVFTLGGEADLSPVSICRRQYHRHHDYDR